MTAVVALGFVGYVVAAVVVVRWRFRVIDADFRRGLTRVLRSAAGSEEAGSPFPRQLPATAGVARPAIRLADAPPAPCPLPGASEPPTLASGRPPLVRLGGAL